EETMVQVLLEEQAGVWPGDRFVVRSYSPVTTIGGGTILCNVSPKKRKRVNESDREKNLKAYDCLKNGSLEERILFYLRDAGLSGLTFNELGVRLGLFGKHLKKAISDPLSNRKMVMVDSANQRYIEAGFAETLKEDLLEDIAAYHKKNPLQAGIIKEELRSGFATNLDEKLFNWCLNDLIKKNSVVQEDSLVRLADHEVALKADEEELQRDLISWYQSKGFFTPTLRETMEYFDEYPESLVKEVVNLQLREGNLVKISETLYYAKEVIEELTNMVVEFIEKEGDIDAPRMKNLTGLTRKFSIPLLEYFDRIKLTMRIEDKRILRKSSN
ncbi:MAG TPA: selenocysteine-specific translation factor, partial [Deltaproteobacteria bacterium]|nr:selenocysteine-specific translation factor [Deltaproteobacteria bacterium]